MFWQFLDKNNQKEPYVILLETQLFPTFFTSSLLLQLMLKVMTCMGIALQNKSESTVYVEEYVVE